MYYAPKQTCILEVQNLCSAGCSRADHRSSHLGLALREMKLMLEKCGLDDSITLRRLRGETREAVLEAVWAGKTSFGSDS